MASTKKSVLAKQKALRAETYRVMEELLNFAEGRGRLEIGEAQVGSFHYVIPLATGSPVRAFYTGAYSAGKVAFDMTSLKNSGVGKEVVDAFRNVVQSIPGLPRGYGGESWEEFDALVLQKAATKVAFMKAIESLEELLLPYSRTAQ